MPRSFDSVFYGAAGTGGASDDEFNRVSFLSHFDGANNGVNNAFDDSSASDHTITAAGNVTQGSFGPFARPDGEWGVAFDGDGDKLTLAASSDFAAGTGDFTFETFLFKTETTSSNQYDGIFYSATTQRIKFQESDSIIRIQTSARDVAIVNNDQGTFIGVWRHLAVCRSSNTLRTYVDGTLATTITLNGDETFGTSSPSVTIGQNGDYFGGLMSNFRYVVGSALYTGSSLTVPTAPLTAVTNTKLLTCQSNRFVDNSASAHTITPTGDTAVSAFGPFLTDAVYDPAVNGASAYFGSGTDYLSTNTVLTLASTPVTIECWVYPSTSSVVGLFDGGTGETNILRNLNANSISKQGQEGTGAAFALKVNAWSHLAIVVQSGNILIYTNGVYTSTGTYTGTFSNGSTFTVGTINTGGDGSFNGYISDFAVYNTVVYTGNFTPPTAPLTAITNTTLLLNMADGQAIDSAAQSNLTLAGNAKLSTGQAKFGDTSLLLDGTGDYFEVPNPTSLAFRTGDFTLECWVYMAVDNTNKAIVETRASDLSANGFAFAIDADGGRKLMVYSNAKLFTTSNAISLNTWTHIAISRSGTTLKCFINGTQGASVTNSQDYTNALVRVGRGIYASSDFNGYIDDLRFSNMARYTANFTAPTAAFPDKGQ